MFAKCIICLVLIALLDTIIPIPFTALLLLYVLAVKPLWFKDLVDTIYQ